MKSYYRRLDFRRFDGFDDDAFAYLMQKVKGVDMLDLNESDIGNDSIKLLAQLEYVNEIRAKGCHSLDNDCIPFLNQIKSLKFLHLNHTGITIDGLLRLNTSSSLRTWMFSYDRPDSVGLKLLELKNLLPDCEFVVNGKPHYF